MVVTSVSLSSDKLEELDALVSEMNYSSRSDAIRDAVHKLIQDHRWVHAAEHRSHFLLSLIYPEKTKHAVLDVLHTYGKMIHSSAHTHFDSMCADQLVLLGGGPDVAPFVKALTAIRDVRLCNCIV